MSDGTGFVIGFLFGVLASLLIVGPVTHTVVNNSWEREAVAVGHAEYYQEGKVTKWRWLPAGDVLTEDE